MTFITTTNCKPETLEIVNFHRTFTQLVGSAFLSAENVKEARDFFEAKDKELREKTSNGYFGSSYANDMVNSYLYELKSSVMDYVEEYYVCPYDEYDDDVFLGCYDTCSAMQVIWKNLYHVQEYYNKAIEAIEYNYEED